MDLYIIRHAIARPASSRVPDSERGISTAGRQRFEEQVRGLHRLGVELDLVLYSPLRRSVETARMLRPLVRGTMRQTDSLMGPPGRNLALLLRDHSVAVVGQEPWLTELIAWLVFGDTQLARQLVLDEGAVAMLDGYPDSGDMQLRSLISGRCLFDLCREPAAPHAAGPVEEDETGEIPPATL